MQLDIFQTAELRGAKVPALSAAAAQVGTPAEWAKLTLSDVLVLWEQLYSDFVGVLDGPINEAKNFGKEASHQQAQGDGGPVARKFYQREFERLVKAQHQLRAAVENRFSDNLLVAIEQAKAVLVAEGLSEEEAEDSHEFFNEVIQRPGPEDLGKLLPVLMQDLAAEYLRLNVAA